MNKIDVVTAYHNDLHKLNWTHYVQDCRLIIYKKNDDLKIGESFINNGEINVPNFGRCDYAFLLHIINNYDNLNDITIFTKINWTDQPNNLPLLVRNCRNYDYMEVGAQSEWYNWHDGINIDNSGCLHSINTKDIKGVRNEWYTYNPDSMIDWYHHIFGEGTVPGKICANAHGPVFSVTKSLIRRHPVSVYQYLLSRFHPDSQSWDNECAKTFWPKYENGATDRQIFDEIGHGYHNHLLRFWKILFTHRVDKSLFKIY